ncbi:MAG: hypothetical protein ABSB97_07665 [Thermoplasmata archaeon]
MPSAAPGSIFWTRRVVSPITLMVIPFERPETYESDIGSSSSPGIHAITNWPGAAGGSYGKRSVTVEGVSSTRSVTRTIVRTNRASGRTI